MKLDPSVYHDLLLSLLPELVLTGWALVLLLFVAWRHQTLRDLRITGWLTLAALLSTAVATWWLWWHRAGVEGLAAMVAVDDFRWVADWVFLGAAALTVLISFAYLEREQLLAPEYYVLLVFGTIGMLVMAAGADLMVIFLGLELMSVAVYVLAGFDRRRARSAEAALKYFLLGAFASGFLLYGIALLYGATGTTNISLIGAQVAFMGQPSVMLLVGLALLIVGFAFKVAAVPFHMWAPDVYDGAPTPVTAFMATAVKAAAFAALFRVLVAGFGGVAAWHDMLWWLAAITMIGGNLFALGQRSLKRMLAYSSVAHAGYLLVAVTAGGSSGTSAFIVYVIAYTLMSLGAFAVLTAKGRAGESDVLIDDLAGLAARRPWLAFALAICMLSLLGLPGTAGFMGKWYILIAATGAGQNTLAAILVLTSVVSAGYYLPVIMAMYMKSEPDEAAHVDVRLDRWGRWWPGCCCSESGRTGYSTSHARPARACNRRRRRPRRVNKAGAIVKLPATIFRQYDIRGLVDEQLTPAAARAVGQAYTTFAWQRLGNGKAPRVAVGRDNRPSGGALAQGVREGIAAAGGAAIDVGELPTPALYFATKTLPVDGGIQVTGSHNPPEFNGFKMVLAHDAVFGDDIQVLYKLIDDGKLATKSGGSSTTHHALLPAYRDAIVKRNTPLARTLKVVVDCGNGVTSLVAVETLRQLGAEVVPLFAESDGTFPHHHPDPTVLENLHDLQAAVKQEKAELGIAFDGDGDRIGAVDRKSTRLNSSHVEISY